MLAASEYARIGSCWADARAWAAGSRARGLLVNRGDGCLFAVRLAKSYFSFVCGCGTRAGTSTLVPMNFKNARAYTLEEVAKWQLDPYPSGVAIPRLQRGLVWKAVKMELLWDSIMRGIPVGAFVVCSRNKLPDQDRQADVHAESYLLDGQQRSAAITMAFRDFPPLAATDEGLPVLWLDVAPDEQANRMRAGKSREFWFKVTTRAHPWGYAYRPREVDGKDTVFSTWERRTSVQQLGGRLPLGRRPTPCQLWPREASSPIPFTFLRRAYTDLRATSGSPVTNGSAFWDKVSALVLSAPSTNWRELKWPNISRPEEHQLLKLLAGLECAHNYELVALRTPDSLMEESTGSDIEPEGAGVSVLFERINTMGEKPSAEELTYSVLKALWPQLYDIDEVARGRMFPYRMAVLAIQVFAIREGAKWDQAVTTPYLRTLMRDAGKKQGIEQFIRRCSDGRPSPRPVRRVRRLGGGSGGFGGAAEEMRNRIEGRRSPPAIQPRAAALDSATYVASRGANWSTLCRTRMIGLICSRLQTPGWAIPMTTSARPAGVCQPPSLLILAIRPWPRDTNGTSRPSLPAQDGCALATIPRSRGCCFQRKSARGGGASLRARMITC